MFANKQFRILIAFLTLTLCLGLLTVGVSAEEPEIKPVLPESASEQETQKKLEALEAEKDGKASEETENSSNPVAPNDTGGPDAFGYTYIDSDEAGGPTYSFVELNGTGATNIPFSDDTRHGPYDLGFTFNYYGVDYTQMWAGSNGWLSLGAANPGDNDNSNDCSLPSTSGVENMIAGIWDDLDQDTTSPYGTGYFQSYAAGSCPYSGYAGACAVTQWDVSLRLTRRRFDL